MDARVVALYIARAAGAPMLVLPIGPTAIPAVSFDSVQRTEFLRALVTSEGKVDYELLERQHALLIVFGVQRGTASPDTIPTLFPTPEYALASWMNATRLSGSWQ